MTMGERKKVAEKGVSSERAHTATPTSAESAYRDWVLKGKRKELEKKYKS